MCLHLNNSKYIKNEQKQKQQTTNNMEVTNDTVLASTLDVCNMDVAFVKYGNFVNINHFPLTQSEFKEAQALQLNEQIASAFFKSTGRGGPHDS